MQHVFRSLPRLWEGRHRRESDDHPGCWFPVCSTVTGTPLQLIPKEKLDIEKGHLPGNNEGP